MAKTHQNCPRAHHPLKKERKKNSFSGSKVPCVGWVTPFTWNVCIFFFFTKLSAVWIILAALWNVPWYFYEVSSQGQVCRQMLSVDGAGLLHTELAGAVRGSGSLNGPLIPVEKCRWGSPALSDRHIIVPDFSEDIPVVESGWKRATHTPAFLISSTTLSSVHPN